MRHLPWSGRRWAVPAGALTWAFAVPGSVVFWGAFTLGVVGAVVALWVSQLRDARRCPPLKATVSREAAERVRAVAERLDPQGRARIVLDTSEPYGSCVPGPRPVICVAPRWLDEPDQLAAAVAHEYGHIIGRHQHSSLRVLFGVPVLWWLTLLGATLARAQGGVAGTLAAAATIAAGLWCCALVVLHARMTQRRHEFDADRVAADVVGATAVVEVLRPTGSDGRAHVGPYSRYPLLADRIATLELRATTEAATTAV